MEAEKKLWLLTAKKLKSTGLVSIGCNKGSLSMRSGSQFLIGPSRIDYDDLLPQNINIMNIDGTVFEQNAPLSMDSAFHSAIYQARGDVGAVVHTHSRFVTALALAGKAIPMIQYAVKLQLGSGADICDFYLPQNPKMNKEIIEKLGDNQAVLIKNHGAIALGKNLEEAFENIVYLEELAQSYVHALTIGKVSEIIVEG